MLIVVRTLEGALEQAHQLRLSQDVETKKIDLGQSIGILANIGVLIGVLLLAYELNQNRRMMRAQTRNSIAETVINLNFDRANSDELSEGGCTIGRVSCRDGQITGRIRV
jgi:hypothetical protein